MEQRGASGDFPRAFVLPWIPEIPPIRQTRIPEPAMSHPVLTALGLAAVESGTYLGNGEWSKTTDAGVIEPVNPSNGEVLGRVHASSQADYDLIVERAQAAYKVWRTTPAPRRGEAIRLCADALRTHKDALGSLVALEMGKSKPEGDGEVQEMIDIGEFAVGLSRQLYGLTMHSERPGHRMYEQWHPIGLVGIISAFNFPVAVWAWNSFVAAVCGDICIWKPSPKTPLSAIASMKICNEALRKGGFPDIFFLFNDAGSDLAQGFVDDKRIPLIASPAAPRSAAWSASAARAAWAAACWNWAATTRSSSTPPPT